TLPFTVTANANWLTATPTSATAPANESIQPVITGLAVGTYSGQVTVTSAGATGSPTLVPVTLTVSAPVDTASDWPMVGQNPSRTSFASNDSVIDKTNVSGMALKWAAVLDGKVSAQPLFLSRVSIAGATHDVVLAATNQNSLYAFDADVGTALWAVNFGANVGGSDYAVPGGLGVRSAPAVDRATGRIFVVSDDGKLHTVSLANGAALAPTLQVIDLPITNKVRGGVNLFGSELYFASGSDGGDTQPWRGRIYHFNVAATAPVLQSTFDVIPGIAGNNRGGGIWSYGGVSVDTVTGNVYASTGADYTGAYTPYAVRVLKLTPNLSLIGSYEPSHPTTFACDGSPCDVDFSASPTVFTPTGCPTMVAAGNKDGHLYVLRTNDFASTTPVYQAMTLNLASDPLANGGVGGIPAFWAAGNMLYVTDSGDGVAGVPAGVVALSISAAPACKLSVAWTVPLPKLGSAQSSPTVVGNVVLVGEGGSGEVHALDAATGAELWNSGTTVTGNTYAAPTVGAGKIFVGSWAGRAPSDIGVLRAFSIAGSGGTGGCTGSPPPVLAGTQVIGSTHDGNVLGMAEAFQATAAGCDGTANAINLYVDAASTAGTVVVGLYADNGGHPGMLLTQAALASPVAGAWNRVPVPAAALTAGSPYWLAVLGTTRGTVAFRTSAGCRSEVSASSALTTLPTTWASGASYTGCPLAAYAGP
ncbi:MAG: PQQ-binding-like beta-propeller repeat protein, partial [Pseudomonadota bacterium]|nr:PQQ-binding-like beta-propeller repeat protein [Pseudomonadota bacterium]